MENKSLIESWPYFWWGYDGLETIFLQRDAAYDDLIAPNWNPSDKEKIIGYLKNNFKAIWTFEPPTPCGLCGMEIDLGGDFCDGTWMWSGGLWHDVESHHAFIPDRFAEHIRSRNYIPAETISIPYENLPWPLRDVEKAGYELRNGFLEKKERD